MKGRGLPLPSVSSARARCSRVRRRGRLTLHPGGGILTKIGRAHVCTPVTNAHIVCRLLLEKKHAFTLWIKNDVHDGKEKVQTPVHITHPQHLSLLDINTQ